MLGPGARIAGGALVRGSFSFAHSFLDSSGRRARVATWEGSVMLQRSAAVVLGTIIWVAGSCAAAAQEAYTEEQLKEAREFIAENLDADKRAFLEDLAQQFKKSPEAMFLDISKRAGDTSLGTGSSKPNVPPRRQGSSSSGSTGSTGSSGTSSGSSSTGGGASGTSR
jgi:hypothetical protein